MDQPPTADLREARQTASRVLMIRPGSFGRNDAAAESNAFMQGVSGDPTTIAETARHEFDGLAMALADAGVEVVIDHEPDLPDSVFPNNWMSFHQPRSGPPVVVTYPMATPLRRRERRAAAMDLIAGSAGQTPRVIPLEHLENRGLALEGTGSLVLDRVAGVAFACRSPRASDEALDEWGRATGFEVVRFDAADPHGMPVYHTNVLMSIGEHFAVFVPETVPDQTQRGLVTARLRDLGKHVIDLSIVQMNEMAANLIELRSKGGDPIIAMSSRAFAAMDNAQLETLEGFARIVHAPIPTIERVGGGSVRCMIAELGDTAL